jgi:hypothetical protein
MKNMSSLEVVHNPKLAGKTQLIQVSKRAWSPVFISMCTVLNLTSLLAAHFDVLEEYSYI